MRGERAPSFHPARLFVVVRQYFASTSAGAGGVGGGGSSVKVR